MWQASKLQFVKITPSVGRRLFCRLHQTQWSAPSAAMPEQGPSHLIIHECQRDQDCDGQGSSGNRTDNNYSVRHSVGKWRGNLKLTRLSAAWLSAFCLGTFL